MLLERESLKILLTWLNTYFLKKTAAILYFIYHIFCIFKWRAYLVFGGSKTANRLHVSRLGNCSWHAKRRVSAPKGASRARCLRKQADTQRAATRDQTAASSLVYAHTQ